MAKAHDVLIIGAGSAGLSSAIFCARKGMSVLVLEKHSETGIFPRGETLRPDPIIDQLLGSGYMDRISFNRTAKRRYYSPGCTQKFDLTRSHQSYIFHWKDLTEGLLQEARKAGAKILFNANVSAPLIQDGRCSGVKLWNGEEYRAGTVVAADGHNSLFGRLSGVHYERINCPIVKRIYRGIASDYDGMEYFFIPPGTLEYAPDFPASVAFIFPRGDGNAEAGLMIFTGSLPVKARAHLPGPETILEVMGRVAETYPVFSQKVKPATLEFEGISMIPMAGLHSQASSVPGLILAGDNLGLVEASGGCGITATMKNARFLSDFLSNHHQPIWDKSLMKQYNHEFIKSDIVKHIKKNYRTNLPFLRIMFRKKRPLSFYNKLWGFLKGITAKG